MRTLCHDFEVQLEGSKSFDCATKLLYEVWSLLSTTAIRCTAIIAAFSVAILWQKAFLTMDGDSFQFSIGPPNSGFSMFMADRTKKVHFIRSITMTDFLSLCCKIISRGIGKKWRTLMTFKSCDNYRHAEGFHNQASRETGSNDCLSDMKLWDARLTPVHSAFYMSNQVACLNLLMLELLFLNSVNRTALINASNLDVS